MSAGSDTRKWAVALSIASLIIAGSLLVALPLTSPDNIDGTALKMYSDALGIVELQKSNNAYVVETGKTVYLQITGVSDDNVMASGTAMNGETEVLIYYSRDGKNYSILFLQVMFQNGNSQLVKWVVGDFDGDAIYNPNDLDDSAIFCGTNGVVIYGKVRSTGMKDFSIATNSPPDFVGCPFTNSSSNSNPSTDGGSNSDSNSNTGDNSDSGGSSSTGGSGSNSGNNNSGNTGNNGSSNNNSGNNGAGTGNSGNNSGNGSSNNGNINKLCMSEKIDGNIKISHEDEVYFEDCKINGNIKIKHSFVQFVASEINGNLKSKHSELIVKNSEIDGNVHVKYGNNVKLVIENSEIDGNVHVKDISIYLINSVIHGNIHCKDVDYSNTGSTIEGNIHGCLSDEEDDHEEDDDDDEDDD